MACTIKELEERIAGLERRFLGLEEEVDGWKEEAEKVVVGENAGWFMF